MKACDLLVPLVTALARAQSLVGARRLLLLRLAEELLFLESTTCHQAKA